MNIRPKLEANVIESSMALTLVLGGAQSNFCLILTGDLGQAVKAHASIVSSSVKKKDQYSLCSAVVRSCDV